MIRLHEDDATRLARLNERFKDIRETGTDQWGKL